jgi:glycosyltransferase involved in cell wall biosynthesis
LEIKISIITVVYNGSKTLEQTIHSVLNQSYKNIEYIIIDGGSTDGTIDIVKKYEKDISLWISEPDKGLYDAMNKGISYAKGELIGMINSDDWYQLDAVEIMVNEYLNNPNCTIFHGDRMNILESGEKKLYKFNPSVFKFKYYGMTYNHPSMFISRKEYDEHLYDTSYKSHSDYKFVLEAFMKKRDKLHYVNKTIANFRLGGISSNTKFFESVKDVVEIRCAAGLNIIEITFSVCLIFVAKLGAFIKKY